MRTRPTPRTTSHAQPGTAGRWLGSGANMTASRFLIVIPSGGGSRCRTNSEVRGLRGPSSYPSPGGRRRVGVRVGRLRRGGPRARVAAGTRSVIVGLLMASLGWSAPCAASAPPVTRCGGAADGREPPASAGEHVCPRCWPARLLQGSWQRLVALAAPGS